MLKKISCFALALAMLVLVGCSAEPQKKSNGVSSATAVTESEEVTELENSSKDNTQTSSVKDQGSSEVD